MGIKNFKNHVKNFARLGGSVYQNLLKAFVILIGGFLITIIAVYFTRQQIIVDENQKFAIICGDLKTDIEARLKAHALLLRSGAAFFAASDTVTRLEWNNFNSSERITGICLESKELRTLF
jgi:CHASE1-domain containing sensor protein